MFARFLFPFVFALLPAAPLAYSQQYPSDILEVYWTLTPHNPSFMFQESSQYRSFVFSVGGYGDMVNAYLASYRGRNTYYYNIIQSAAVSSGWPRAANFQVNPDGSFSVASHPCVHIRFGYISSGIWTSLGADSYNNQFPTHYHCPGDIPDDAGPVTATIAAPTLVIFSDDSSGGIWLFTQAFSAFLRDWLPVFAAVFAVAVIASLFRNR